jgi:hypothetical protein
MKKRNSVTARVLDDLRPEYQFDYSKGRKNPYASRLAGKTVLVVLDADVAAAFPTAASVNRALRSVMRLGFVRKRSSRKRGTRTATPTARAARARRGR